MYEGVWGCMRVGGVLGVYVSGVCGVYGGVGLYRGVGLWGVRDIGVCVWRVYGVCGVWGMWLCVGLLGRMGYMECNMVLICL